MKNKTKRFSPRSSSIGLLLLGFFLIGLGLWLSNQTRGQFSGHFTRPLPTIPLQFRDPGSPRQDLTTIQAFIHRMDSLKRSNTALYDSISRCHPGLLDSARTLEAYYSHVK